MSPQNTGQRYKESLLLNRLRTNKEVPLNFNIGEIERTGAFLQIPTQIADQEAEDLRRLAARFDGKVVCRDGNAWVYLKHVQSFPLLVIGIRQIVIGVFLVFVSYNINDLIYKVLWGTV